MNSIMSSTSPLAAPELGLTSLLSSHMARPLTASMLSVGVSLSFCCPSVEPAPFQS